MSTKAIISAIVVLVVVFVGSNSLFSVREGQSALVLRLGEITKDSQGQARVFGPGLHFKTPFINNVRKFDVRLQNLEAESPRILTKEQKYLYVDYYAKWRITDLPLYYTRTNGVPAKAENLLVQKINDSIRAEFGRKELHEVISDDRLKIMASLQRSANQGAQELGLKIVDVRIKSIDLLKSVQQSVFQRMSTKREQVATEYRASGQAESEKIRSTADASARKMVADAQKQAAVKRAEGDALAADIYLKAYTKDPTFYALYRSLEAYRQVFRDKDTVMVLRPDSQFFKYFNQPDSVKN